jgi:2-polyprenyl-3-methyl-5-hydroxy-6-metoxy-1,4-benzoquinol methylase
MTSAVRNNCFAYLTTRRIGVQACVVYHWSGLSRTWERTLTDEHEEKNATNPQQAWNAVSAAYLAGKEGADSVDYGPLCPTERELRLLADLVGEVRGLDVLDAGCGGGENAISLAQSGAAVTAVDFSGSQLDHAVRAAYEAGVQVDFHCAEIEGLSWLPAASQDLVLCTQVLLYVERPQRALAAFRRVLRPGGWLIASMDHPFRSCFYDEDEDELTNYAERSYFGNEPRNWLFDGTATIMRSYDHPVSAWVELLREAGLPLRRLLEPPTPPEILDELFPEDGPLASLRNVPHTLILVAGGEDA